MDKKTWYIVGVIAVVAAAIGLYMRSKSNTSSDDAQSQLPAEQAQANYSVPPNIGMSVDNTGGANFPMGESGFTYTVAQANSLPSNGDGS